MRAASVIPAGRTTARPAVPALHVLCVDDHAPTCRVLRIFLEHGGCTVRSARDGAAAWELINAHEFDLIVCAHEMRGRKDPHLVWEVRHAGLTLPIVLTYGSLDWLDQEELQALQIVGALLKPFSQAELVAEVTRALAWHKNLHARPMQAGPQPAPPRRPPSRHAIPKLWHPAPAL